MAGILTVQTIQGPTSGANANKVIIPAGQTLDIDSWTPPAGTVLQVQQAVKTDTFSTTSGTYVTVTGLSVDITPTSTSSKILIMPDITLSSTHYVWHCGLFENGVEIGLADAASNRHRSFLSGVANGPSMNTDGIMRVMSRQLLRSPNTTSTITYDIRVARRFDNENTPTTYVNRSVPDRDTNTYDHRAISSLTVWEIAG